MKIGQWIDQKDGWNRNQLKYLAIAAMLLDHIAMFFLANTGGLYFLMRVIGRLTAPIMCYFIAEGVYYTRSRRKYGIRLAVFAVISQFAYSFAHYQKWFTMEFSMIYTLLLSFLVLVAYQSSKNTAWKWIVVIGLIIVSGLGDWGIIAPIWTLIFGINRENKKKKYIGYSIIAIVTSFAAVIFCIINHYPLYKQLWMFGTLLAVPVFELYNGQPGSKKSIHKWFFYFFYPVHLVVIGAIKLFF